MCGRFAFYLPSEKAAVDGRFSELVAHFVGRIIQR